MKTILLAILSAATAFGQVAGPPAPKLLKDWLPDAHKATQKLYKSGGYSHPQGDWIVPPEGLLVDKTIDLEVRHSLVGSHWTVSNSMPGLVAAPGFDGFLVRQLPGYQQKRRASPNWNHPSGATYRNLVLRCNRTADGLDVGGAQTTTIERVTVDKFKNTGINIRKASHAFAIRDVYLVGSVPYTNRVGTCLRISSTKTLTVDTAKIHRAAVGIHATNVLQLQLTGIDVEHVTKPLILSGSMIRGMVRIARSGPVVADLTGVRECDFAIQVTAPTVPGTQYFIDRNGRKQALGTVPKTGNGRFYRLTCNVGTGYQVRVTSL